MATDSFYDFGVADTAVATEPAAHKPSTGVSILAARTAARSTGAGAVVAECEALTHSLQGVLAVIVATSDGMLIHSSWSEVEGMRAAAISAAALGLGQRIAADFGQGEFHDSVVSTGDRVIGIYAVGDGYVLGVVAVAEDVSLGLLHLNARRTAAAMKEILEAER